jgi:hypothetical protein
MQIGQLNDFNLSRVRRHPVAILHKPVSEAALLGSLCPMVARKAQG